MDLKSRLLLGCLRFFVLQNWCGKRLLRLQLEMSLKVDKESFLCFHEELPSSFRNASGKFLYGVVTEMFRAGVLSKTGSFENLNRVRAHVIETL